jgi:hypothetical protein
MVNVSDETVIIGMPMKNKEDFGKNNALLKYSLIMTADAELTVPKAKEPYFKGHL